MRDFADAGHPDQEQFSCVNPPLLSKGRSNGLDLTCMIEQVNASKEEPFSPMHRAKFRMTPGDVQVSILGNRGHQRNHLDTESFQVSQQILTSHLCGGWSEHIADV